MHSGVQHQLCSVFVYSGVQHQLCSVFVLFVFACFRYVASFSGLSILIDPSVFSNVYLQQALMEQFVRNGR